MNTCNMLALLSLSMLVGSGGVRAACPSEALDLDKVNLSSDYASILRDAPRLTEGEQIATHLPIAFTYAVDQFCFGDISLPLTSSNNYPRNQVGVLINNATERKTVGLRIQVEDDVISAVWFDMLKQKYGNPVILRPEPPLKTDGAQLGYAAYWWDRDEPIILVHEYSYEYSTHSRTRGMTFYRLINRNVRDSGNREVIDRLRESYEK